MKTNCEGYLRALSAIHNKEQHSANGNIEFTCIANATRIDVAESAIVRCREIEAVRKFIATDTDQVIMDVDDRMSSINVETDPNIQAVHYGANGTPHQFLLDWSIVTDEVLDNYDSSVDGITCETSAFVETFTSEEAISYDIANKTTKVVMLKVAQKRYNELYKIRERQRLKEIKRVSSQISLLIKETAQNSESFRDIISEKMRHISYVGVGSSNRFERGAIIISEHGSTLLSESNSDEAKGTGINDSKAYNIAKHTIGGCS